RGPGSRLARRARVRTSSLKCSCYCLIVSQRASRGALEQRWHVEEQGHFPAAENRGPANALDAVEQPVQRFDYGLELPEQGIHHQARPMVTRADHDDVLTGCRDSL